METRLAYWVTFIATVAACFLFGMPFTGTLMRHASGVIDYESEPPLNAGALIISGVIYFGVVFAVGWLPLGKKEGQKTVQIIAIGVQLFTAIGAFGGSYEGGEIAALMPPLLISGFIALVFWFVRYQDRQRQLENPQN